MGIPTLKTKALLWTIFACFALWEFSASSNIFRREKTEDELIQLIQQGSGDVASNLQELEKRFPNSSKGIPVIKSLLNDPREKVRRKAARVLGAIHAELADPEIDSIAKMLKAGSVGEVADSLKALRGLKAERVVPDIIPLLKHKDEGILRDACRTLAVLGSQENIPFIEPLLKHPSKHVQVDAKEAIERLRFKIATPVLAKPSPPPSNKIVAVGTGFIVAEAGYVLTCEHVVSRSKDVNVRDIDGMIYPATIIATDPANDLCLLHVPALTNAPFASIPPNSVEVGQSVFCLGFPLEGGEVSNQRPVVGSGIVASLRGLEGDTRHLQITLPMNPGNSGGPVFDSRGRWVGVASHKLSDLYRLTKSTSVAQGFNFAVKASLASPLFDSAPAAKLPTNSNIEPLPLEQLVKKLSPSVVLVIAK